MFHDRRSLLLLNNGLDSCSYSFSSSLAGRDWKKEE